MSRHSHVDELIEWYALGTLLPEELAAVEVQLDVCAECRRLAAEAVAIVNQLPYTTEPATPSPELKAKLMARVDADLRRTHSAEAYTAARDSWRTRLEGWLRPSLGFALAGAALIVLLALWNWNLQNELNRTQEELAALINAATQVATLPPANAAPKDAQAKLFIAPESQEAVLAVSGLKPLSAAQTYELWLIRGAQPVPAGTFNVGADGSARLLVRSAEPLGRFEQAGITIEQAGGANTPNLNTLVFVGSIKP